MSVEMAVREAAAIVEARPTSGLALSFGEMTMRVAQVDQFYRQVMQDGTDYGKIPGTDKPTLYQPGAQMLDQIFGYSTRFEVMPSSTLDWQRPIPFFHYVIMCRLISLRSGDIVAEGIGSCNSYEDKYRWRNAKPSCPECGKELFRSKQKPEWFCWRSKGGCGGVVALDAVPAGGKVENEDSASLENTISKMAQKRAHIAATLNATGASRIFTQDIEDLPQFQDAIARATVVQASSAPASAPQDDPPPPPPPPADGPADPTTRARFDANWKTGIARAVACGIAPEDAPKPDATQRELKKAGRELLEQIKSRETLNAELVARTAEVKKACGPEAVADVDPATCTSVEIHEMLATLAEMLAATPDDSEAF